MNFNKVKNLYKVNCIFKLDDYIELNKDLHIKFKNKSDYIEHYNKQGYKEGRLINKEQLNVCNEFGNELVLFIPYYYYLYKNNLLFDNVIETYEGMEPYYVWCNPENVRYKNAKREWRRYFVNNVPTNWLSFDYNPLVYNDNDHVNEFDVRYAEYFDYKEYYLRNKEQVIKFDNEKPIIIICNKITKEWGLKPINYYKKDELEKLIQILISKFNIIYTCNSNNKNRKNYSYDYNELNMNDELMYLDEISEMISKYSEVIVFEEYVDKNGLDYNTTKCITYANCDDYITVQGGNSYMVSYFFKRMFVLHIYGNEIQGDINTYQGWFKNMNKIDKEEKNVYVEDNFEKLYNKIKNQYNL